MQHATFPLWQRRRNAKQHGKEQRTNQLAAQRATASERSARTRSTCTSMADFLSASCRAADHGTVQFIQFPEQRGGRGGEVAEHGAWPSSSSSIAMKAEAMDEKHACKCKTHTQRQLRPIRIGVRPAVNSQVSQASLHCPVLLCVHRLPCVFSGGLSYASTDDLAMAHQPARKEGRRSRPAGIRGGAMHDLTGFYIHIHEQEEPTTTAALHCTASLAAFRIQKRTALHFHGCRGLQRTSGEKRKKKEGLWRLGDLTVVY